MSRAWEPRLWVLVADGERARVMKPDSVEGHFHTVLRLGTVEGCHCPPPLRNQTPGSARDAFVADVAHRLDAEAETESFDQLILVAPGIVLHDVKAMLGPQAQARLVGELARDCAGLDDDNLSRHLSRWWLAPAVAA
jgi:protein required for attachment to host cells